MRMVGVLLASVFLVFSSAIGAEVTRRYKSVHDGMEYTLVITGNIDQASSANSGDLLFSGHGVVGDKTPFGDFMEVNYLGRTGEKSFDIGYRSGGNGVAAAIDKRLSVYFDKKTPFELPLDFLAAYAPPCKTTDVVLLKMIELNGNKLKFKLTLPACLSNRQ